MTQDVTSTSGLHRILELICRILQDDTARRSIMQAWISMATAIPEPIQASDVDSSPSSTHDRFDITYQDQGISQDSSPDQRQHSKRQRSTTKHNNPPSHIPRPSSSTRQVQYESQTVPWTKMLDPDEEKRVAKKWWDSVGRDAMTGGYQLPT